MADSSGAGTSSGSGSGSGNGNGGGGERMKITVKTPKEQHVVEIASNASVREVIKAV